MEKKQKNLSNSPKFIICTNQVCFLHYNFIKRASNSIFSFKTHKKHKNENSIYKHAEWDLLPMGIMPEQGIMLQRFVTVSRAYRSAPYSSCSGESYHPLATSLPPHTYMMPSTPVAVWKSLYTGAGPWLRRITWLCEP